MQTTSYAYNSDTGKVEETTTTTVITPLDPTSVQSQIDAVNSQIASYKQQLVDYTNQINNLVANSQTQLTSLQSQLDNLNHIIAENIPVNDTTPDTTLDSTTINQ